MARADNPLRIPEALRHEVEEIFQLTDPFCAAHLDAEYAELVRTLIAKLARKRPSPLVRGDLRIWVVMPGRTSVSAYGADTFRRFSLHFDA